MQKLLILILSTILFSCSTKNETYFKSSSNTEFKINFENDETLRKYLSEGFLSEGNCELNPAEIAGEGCLEIKTNSEFSDGFIHVNQLFGHYIDFSNACYLYMRLYIPEESWICAMKLNFQDDVGNNGGCKEVFNNFYGHTNQWLDFVVDLQEIKDDFQNWKGTENTMQNSSSFSLNPYCGHQGKKSSIYISKIELTSEKKEMDYHPSLAPKVNIQPNIPFEMNFDNEQYLRNIMAYRGFESTFQAVENNIGGNPTTAIRIKANATNKHFVFLPEMIKVTGNSVDFTKVDSLYFDYYIPEDSGNISHMMLFLTDDEWHEMYQDQNITDSFKKGKWDRKRFCIKDLNLEKVKGEKETLSAIEEIRLDVMPIDEKRDFEIWIDNFGWK